MRIEIRRPPAGGRASVIQQIEKRLGLALHRFRNRVSSIDLFFEDTNGPRGGPHFRCRAIARVKGLKQVFVEGREGQFDSLVDQLAKRLREVVARRLERRRFGRPRVAFDGQPEHRAS